MSKLVARFAKDESGATAIEYGLIAALIGIAIMVGSSLVGNAINNLFTSIANKLNGSAAA
jgi:pilus assembly protein Flp/PilA